MRRKIGRLFVLFLLMWVVSGYFFEFGFTFLPGAVTSKRIMAVVGVFAFLIRTFREKSLRMSKIVVVSAAIAIIFSVWCFYSMTANETDDITYATYIVSFVVWLGGAFGVTSVLKSYHGYCNLKLVTDYLMVASVMQCVTSQMIEHIPAFQLFVDSIFELGQWYLRGIGRLYGIGASLDTGGVRFSCVMLLMAHQVATNKWVTDKAWRLMPYLLSFAVIIVLGNMIARTTIVGAGLAIAYMLMALGLSKRGNLTYRQMRFYGVLIGIIVLAVVICSALYNSNPEFHSSMRFAFEGFFNWVETGEFRTDSTDVLNDVMWIWPDNFRDWMIGTGIFGSWYYSTDIGYCRFVLYCGLIGMGIFSLFFIYNGLILNKKFSKFWLASLLIASLSFVIWLKVATDIFVLDAILFCVDGDYDENGDEIDWNAELEPESEPEEQTA